MKKTFKKAVAMIAAAASLTVGMTAISANAASSGSVTFGNGATASIYRSSTQINISTSYNSGTKVYVQLVSTSGASVSGVTNQYGYNGYASLNYTGNGFTKATSYHEGAGGSITLTR